MGRETYVLFEKLYVLLEKLLVGFAPEISRCRKMRKVTCRQLAFRLQSRNF